MPKRMCPFEYDLIHQNKVHISDKEVCDYESMKSVYDKTLKMLFVGARRVVNMAETEVAIKQHLGSSFLKHNYKQMFLDNQCQLQFGGTVKTEQKLQCQSCSLPSSEIQTKCMFCEKFLCTHCIITCAKCSEEFCNACSLVVYSDLEDEHLCFDCCR